MACEADVDDYATVDISRRKRKKTVPGNGQLTLSRMRDLVGIGFKPEKHCPQAQQGNFLGGTTISLLYRTPYTRVPSASLQRSV